MPSSQVKRGRLEEWVDDFLEYLFSVRGYSESTVKTYEQALRQMLELSEIRREAGGWLLDLLPLRRRLSSDGRRTTAKKLSAIRSFARYCRDQRKISLSLRGDDPVRVPRTLPKPVEEEYIREVMEGASREERALLALLYGLGLRISELVGIDRSACEGEWIRIRGKGGKVRQIPIPAGVRKILREYLEEKTTGRYLFEKGGVPLNDAQLRYRVKKLFRAHGIDATPHRLRHAFASHLLEHGARISDVSELLGHSSMATTQIYTELGSAKKLEEYRKAHPLHR
jgi:integrase/recombinase XerC